LIKPGLPYNARYVDRNGILLFGKEVNFQAVIGNALAVVMDGASEHRRGENKRGSRLCIGTVWIRD